MTIGSQVLILFAIIAVLFIVLFIRLRQGIRASQERKTIRGQNLNEILENHSELRSFVMMAKQGGASHFEYTGPGIIFYRTNNGRTERCLAEYAPSSGRFEWVWGPSDWKEYNKISEHASSIPEII